MLDNFQRSTITTAQGFGARFTELQPLQRYRLDTYDPALPDPMPRAGFPLGRMEWISRRTTLKKRTSCQGWKRTMSWRGTPTWAKPKKKNRFTTTRRPTKR